MLQIYLTDLSAYNAGLLSGHWVRLPLNEEDIASEVRKVLYEGEKSVTGFEHEEYFISDYEWEGISFFNIGEYDNLLELNYKLKLLEDVEPQNYKAIKFLLDYGICDSLEEAMIKCSDVNIYEEQTLEDVAYNLINDCYDISSIPSIITSNIDYKAIARDLEMEGSYYIVDDNVIEYIG